MNLEPGAVEALGDRGLVVRFDGPESRELTERLMGISLAAAKLPGVVDAAPGLTSVLIELEPTARFEVEARLPELLGSLQPLIGQLHELAVRYDGDDLLWVLEHLGMTEAELIRLHSTPVYDVRLVGSPGFIYLSNVPPEIALPRLETPRSHVPAGSVGIGGRQAGIYGRPRPGGWRIVATAASVPQMRPGDRVRFVP